MNRETSVTVCTECAIIGMACRYAKADTLKDFWSNILQGVDTASQFSEKELIHSGIDELKFKQPNYIRAKPCLDRVEYFDADFFGFSKREAEFLDPQIRVFLEVAYHALEDAAYNSEFVSENVGVFAGASTSVDWIKHIFYHSLSLTQSEALELWVLSCKDFLSQIVSYRLNLTGPSYTLYTACSTSLAAVHLACQSLLRNECSLALAGGVSIDLPLYAGYLHEPGMIHSKDGKCRPFDEAASGTVFGDGAGAIILKKLDRAIKDRDQIYAVIKGSHCNNDGRRKANFFAPSTEGQTEVLENAYLNAKTHANTIDFIETHGTATKIGDPIEFEGLKIVHADRNTPCSLGSVKANIGHLHAAAGISGLMKAVLALKKQTIPPLTYFETLNSEINNKKNLFHFPKEAKPWPKPPSHSRRAAISSFGVGGTNVHLIVEEAPPISCKKSDELINSTHFFPLSAKTKNSLKLMTKEFLSFIKDNPNIDLSSIAGSLQIGRKSFPYRKIFSARSHDELRSKQYSENEIEELTGNVQPLILIHTNCSHDTFTNSEGLYLSLQLSELNQKWFGLLCKYMPKKSYIRVIDFLKSRTQYVETFEAKLACSLIRLQGLEYLLSKGIKPHAQFGDQEGSFLAAISSNPKDIEDLFVAYLFKLNPNWFDSVPNQINKSQEIIYRHSLEKLLKDHTLHIPMFYLIHGEKNSLPQIPLIQHQNYREVTFKFDFQLSNTKILLSELWQAGVSIDWQPINQCQNFNRVSLPNYPFEKKYYWFENNKPIEKNDALMNLNYLEDKKKLSLQEYSEGEIHDQIRDLFQEVLNINQIKIEDNFFRLGGDSLQLIQIISKLNMDFNSNISLEEAYLAPSIKRMTELLMNSEKKEQIKQ